MLEKEKKDKEKETWRRIKGVKTLRLQDTSPWGELINNALKTNTIKYLVTFQAFNACHLNGVS